MLASYDFSGFGHTVDVGGGAGGLLAAILESAPQLCVAHLTIDGLVFTGNSRRVCPTETIHLDVSANRTS